jgi:hypothetical protein
MGSSDRLADKDDMDAAGQFLADFQDLPRPGCAGRPRWRQRLWVVNVFLA